MRAAFGMLALGALGVLACDEGSQIDSGAGIGARLEALEARIALVEAENARLTSALADAATKPWVTETALAEYAKVADLAACAKTSDLGVYALKSELGGFATTSSVTTALSDYVKSADLAPYAKIVDLAPYATDQELTGALDRLTTIEDDAVRLIAEDMTLAVPSAEFPTLPDALSWLSAYDIAGTATVEIQLGDNAAPYEFTAPIEVQHRDGARIHIIGNTGDPSKVVLAFTDSHGFVISNGRALGLLDGVTLRGNEIGNFHGAFARDNGSITLGSSVRIEKFGRDCVRANRGGVVAADGVQVQGCKVDGFRAVAGGVISAFESSSRQNGRRGYVASGAAFIDATSSIAEENGNHGYTANSNAVIWADDGSQALDNGLNGFGGGFTSWGSGHVSAEACVAEGNAGPGFAAWGGSHVDASFSTARGNQNGFDAGMNGTMEAQEATADSNSGAGFGAGAGSVVDAFYATATGNGWVGIWNGGGGYLNAVAATLMNNLGGGLACGGSWCDADWITAQDNVDPAHPEAYAFGLNAFWDGFIVTDNYDISGHGPWDTNLPMETEDVTRFSTILDEPNNENPKPDAPVSPY